MIRALLQGEHSGARGRGREPTMLAPTNLKTRLVRCGRAPDSLPIFNKRKEVIRCLMVQLEARFCSFGG